MDKKIAILSKTRTFLSDPKLLNGSVYISDTHSLRTEGRCPTIYQTPTAYGRRAGVQLYIRHPQLTDRGPVSKYQTPTAYGRRAGVQLYIRHPQLTDRGLVSNYISDTHSLWTEGRCPTIYQTPTAYGQRAGVQLYIRHPQLIAGGLVSNSVSLLLSLHTSHLLRPTARSYTSITLYRERGRSGRERRMGGGAVERARCGRRKRERTWG
jgi:hypothetical protein